jgi:hypothetical protein
MEVAMNAYPIRRFLPGSTAIALAGLASFSVAAADAERATTVAASPVVIAQASRSAAMAPRLAVPNDAYPAIQRGVRQAAAEGNEALRRYVWRTRMIYNFQYRDFVLDE